MDSVKTNRTRPAHLHNHYDKHHHLLLHYRLLGPARPVSTRPSL